jgi:hypothetical protein
MAGMIDVVHQGPIAVVTLRRPPANAMNLEFTSTSGTGQIGEVAGPEGSWKIFLCRS